MDFGNQNAPFQINPNEASNNRILILVSRIKQGKGGVAAYFRSLDREISKYVQYLSIGGARAGGSLLLAPLHLCRDWLALRGAVSGGHIGVVHVNPSLLWKATLREGAHILIAKASGKKVLVFWHGWDWTCARHIKKPLFRRLFLSVYGRADCHIVLAEEFRNYLREIGCHAPIICESTVVSGNIIHKSNQTRRTRLTGEPIKLLFLSRLQKEKGIYTAIDTTALLNNMGIPAQLVVAGDGEERKQAEEYVIQNHIAHVSFPGYVNGEEKERILCESEIYLFPSTHGEGMPLSVLDAMAAGLPVLCTRTGGLDDFFVDGKMGFSTTLPAANTFASLILRVVSDPEQEKAIGIYNQSFVNNYFQPPIVTQRLVRIYQFLLEENPSKRIPPDWMESSYQPVSGECNQRLAGAGS